MQFVNEFPGDLKEENKQDNNNNNNNQKEMESNYIKNHSITTTNHISHRNKRFFKTSGAMQLLIYQLLNIIKIYILFRTFSPFYVMDQTHEMFQNLDYL